MWNFPCEKDLDMITVCLHTFSKFQLICFLQKLDFVREKSCSVRPYKMLHTLKYDPNKILCSPKGGGEILILVYYFQGVKYLAICSTDVMMKNHVIWKKYL